MSDNMSPKETLLDLWPGHVFTLPCRFCQPSVPSLRECFHLISISRFTNIISLHHLIGPGFTDVFTKMETKYLGWVCDNYF